MDRPDRRHYSRNRNDRGAEPGWESIVPPPRPDLELAAGHWWGRLSCTRCSGDISKGTPAQPGHRAGGSGGDPWCASADQCAAERARLFRRPGFAGTAGATGRTPGAGQASEPVPMPRRVPGAVHQAIQADGAFGRHDLHFPGRFGGGGDGLDRPGLANSAQRVQPLQVWLIRGTQDGDF